MTIEEFRGAIEEAKRLEKRIIDYSPYQGDMAVEKTLDLEPKDYVDLNYTDMINLYERTQKIISTTGMGILAEKGAEVPQAVETVEIESKLREMTSETLKTAEEVAKEPIVLEKEAPAPEAPKAERGLEFETKPVESFELERPAPQPEKEIPLGRTVEEPRYEMPSEKRVIVAVPPALAETSDKAGEKRIGQLEEQIKTAVGEQADEMTLKKKMLDLTTQLFKEKTTSRREEINLQIKA